MDLEIVGLESSTNGRSCSIHTACGTSVKKGDILRLVPCVVTINHEVEPALKCVKVIDAVDTCTVGFVPRVQSQLKRIREHSDQFVQVTELYAESESPYKRTKSYSNHGMASAVLLRKRDGRDE